MSRGSEPVLFADEAVMLIDKARWYVIVAKHDAWIMYNRWQGDSRQPRWILQTRL